jgi:hypothetical protein
MHAQLSFTCNCGGVFVRSRHRRKEPHDELRCLFRLQSQASEIKFLIFVRGRVNGRVRVEGKATRINDRVRVNGIISVKGRIGVVTGTGTETGSSQSKLPAISFSQPQSQAQLLMYLGFSSSAFTGHKH